jgi:catechol 2,3-dioxygenase-like lactoylglutathione lyase family enzyme
MEWRLEVVVIPVSDVDRARAFYADTVGFHLDHDNAAGDAFRVVQLTPNGSGCSIAFGVGLAEMQPGAVKGLQLVVSDIQAARAELLERGAEVSDIRHFDTETGAWAPGYGGAWSSFFFFSDPDGNGWAVQEGPVRE